jgi:hypothetical protein
MDQPAQQQNLPQLQQQAAQQDGHHLQERPSEHHDQAQPPNALQTQPLQQQEREDAAQKSVAAQQQEQRIEQTKQPDPQQQLLQLQEQMQVDYSEQVQAGPYQQQQQQIWYQLDARGKIDNYDEDDWFVPEVVPFKRRQNVSSTMAASRPHPWKRVRHHIAAENYSELPADVPTYVSLEAPPPLYPPKRYCDVTGA